MRRDEEEKRIRYWYIIEDIIETSKTITPMDLIRNLEEELEKFEAGGGHYIYECRTAYAQQRGTITEECELYYRQFDMGEEYIVFVVGFPHGITKDDLLLETTEDDISLEISYRDTKLGDIRIEFDEEIDPNRVTAKFEDNTLVIAAKKRKKDRKKIVVE